MRYAFAIEADAGMLRDVTPGSGQVTVFAAPTEVEQQELHDAMGIDDHTIASALDPEAISRLEVDAATERITIIWKRPGDRRGHRPGVRCLPGAARRSDGAGRGAALGHLTARRRRHRAGGIARGDGALGANL